MTIFEKYALGFCAGILIYTWAGYPLLLRAVRKLAKAKPQPPTFEPSFSIVVAVHNEAQQIEAKLRDCLAFEYPCERVEVLVASDDSDDGTDELVNSLALEDRRIRLLRTGQRTGKSGAQNLAAAEAKNEILLFTDAGTRAEPQLLRKLGRYFADPKVGLIAPVIEFRKFGTAVSKGQNRYWDFETRLRQWESDMGLLATCSGAAFALRRSLFKSMPLEFGDDCVVPLDVKLQGYNVVQAPEVQVSDEMPSTPKGELRSRIRMTARNLSGTLSRASLLNPLRFPGAAWALISHKLLRWLTPFFILGLFISNLLLFCRHEFEWLFFAQCVFFLAGMIGWRRSQANDCAPVFAYPFAFCLANAGFLLGAVMCLRDVRITAYK